LSAQNCSKLETVTASETAESYTHLTLKNGAGRYLKKKAKETNWHRHDNF
jgi:hypothetical protein